MTNIERRHEAEFPSWFKKRIQALRDVDPDQVSDNLYAIACGPDLWVASYSGCVMNGIRFHTKSREINRRTQNSGVLVTGEYQSAIIDFYGVLNNILELRYMGCRCVWLFSCDWFNVGDTIRGIHISDHVTSVNMSRTWYRDDPFVLPCQASQVFYIRDTKLRGSWYVVQKITYRNVYDVPQLQLNDDSREDDVYQEEQSSDVYRDVEFDQNGLQSPWLRPDVLPQTVPTAELTRRGNDILDDEAFINNILEDSVDDCSDEDPLEDTDEDSSEDTDAETEDV